MKTWEKVKRAALRRGLNGIQVTMLESLYYCNGIGAAEKAMREWPVPRLEKGRRRA